MNWTGGRLQRHSKNKAKSTDLARQKQYFAAVRQRLQNGETVQGAPPFRPSFLIRDRMTLANGTTPFGQGSQRHTGHSKGKQRVLDDYSSTAPLAQRLSSMQKCPVTVTSRNQPARQRKPPSSHHRHSAQSYEAASEDEPSPRTRGDAASSSSQNSATRKRGRSRLEEEDLLELSRKKLLLQHDWIGLAHSRPVQISFTSRQEKERIGKRRRIDSDIEQRQKMFGKIKQVDNDYAHPPFMSGALGVAPESISVRIGHHALSTQVSVAPQDPVRLRESVEQIRQSSESMLFDVEQRRLSQPQGSGLTERRVEQDPRSRVGMNHTQEQDVSGSHALPVCISDDTDISEDSASALDEDMGESESTNETADAAIEEGLGVQQLLDRLNGQDSGDDQHDDDHGHSPIPPVREYQPPLAPFRLVFESSSNHNGVLPSDSPLESIPRDDTLGAFVDHADRNSSPSDTGEADPKMPNFVNVHTTQARQPSFQEIDEVRPLGTDIQDADAPWRQLFSIPSSNSAFAIDELDTDNETNTIEAHIAQPRRITEKSQSNHNEYWRKFVFGDEDEDNDEDDDEEDDKTTAAQPTTSDWPSSSPKQNHRSAKPNLTSKSSMETHTSTRDASPAFRPRAVPSIWEYHSSKAHASTTAALSMKNNVSNPSDSSAETDGPVKSKARGRSGNSHRVGNKEMAHDPSPDLRQQNAGAAQGRSVVMFERTDRFGAGDVSRIGKGMCDGKGKAVAVTGGRGRGGSKPEDRVVCAGDAREERSGRFVQSEKARKWEDRACL
ncbi:hypothetical protein EG328_000191 [Venturia inaequalis]|uniref:Uncharacterized protein n=1 Tax=Venturia inaequalis TaxID=5025 RepID=A0A8H3V3Z8_VENIN|nr:hypothetical protein EG328_000191 [Venturia inaequalis]